MLPALRNLLEIASEGELSLDELTLSTCLPPDSAPLHLLAGGNVPGSEVKGHMIKLLLDARANPHVGDGQGRSPLHKVFAPNISARRCVDLKYSCA